MKDKFIQQTRREYSPKQRLAALVLEAIFFLLLLPPALTSAGAWIDESLKLPRWVIEPFNAVVGGLMIAGGVLFALWSIYAQFTIGRGTPVPLMATQKLVVQPPFTYCRNPMTFGTILLYGGIAILPGSIGALLVVLVGALLLVAYIKRVEEKELELRFGDEYLEYKRRTPFLIPRFQ